jgi:DGQHR domain-containing protein
MVAKRKTSEDSEVTYSVSLVTQGAHRLYTLSMPSNVLAECSTVDTRAENPLEGFQRKLDSKRAAEIARYIDDGPGTIPCAIVLSAQTNAKLVYRRDRRSITFRKTPRSFLILDGQHRVFGFAKAKSPLRVPVVIYNNLTRAEECRLFIDINTNQRPVPNELLLDIKRLAETETNEESLLTDVFDLFAKEPDSPLLGLMTPAEKARGKLSRVTFNAAVNTVVSSVFPEADARKVYDVLGPYLRVWVEHLQKTSRLDLVSNPTFFRAMLLLFQDVAQRVSDRHGGDYSAENFREVLGPFLNKLKKAIFEEPGNSHIVLAEKLKTTLRGQFTIVGL